MTLKASLIASAVFVLLSANTLTAKEKKSVKPAEEQSVHTTTKTIIGSVEKVRILPGNLVLEARIDTGAKTSSIGVDSYETIQEDGVEMVEITVGGHTSKHKVVRFVSIKQHGSKAKTRPVIKLRMILGEVSDTVDVTLADRSNFKYKLLVGRNLLYDHFVVDVSMKQTTSPKPYEEK